MASISSLSFPNLSPNTTRITRIKTLLPYRPTRLALPITKPRQTHLRFSVQAQEANSNEDPKLETTPVDNNPEIKEEVSGERELKPEFLALKEAMKERHSKEEGDLVSGVLEEIREIEWPVFGKVLGTTGVVLAVIAGSSIVLLTVNAVFAELSDRVFAGKGVQDFFS